MVNAEEVEEDEAVDDGGESKEEPGEDDTEEPLVDAEGWQDLMSGKIKKRVLREGTGRCPEMKEDARCSVEIRLAADSQCEGEPHVQYQEVRYRIGEGEAVPMLELCLRHMKEGEEAELFGFATMAWGPKGLKRGSPSEKDIPPDVNIHMKVKLLEVLATDAEDPPWSDMIQTVTWRKTNGNDHYKRKEFKRAERCYTSGIEVFQNRGFEPPDSVKEADRPSAKAAAILLVTDCGANLAAVFLEQGDTAKAKETALAALETRPEHIKCFYRAAKACLILDDFEECEGLLKRGLALEPENAALKQVEADLRLKQRKYEAKSKRAAEAILFGRQDLPKIELDYPDLVAKKAAQQAQDEYEETWGFWIREEVGTWFSKKILAVAATMTLVLVVVLLLIPKKWWPLGLIGYVMGLPAAIQKVSAKDDEENDQKKSVKSKKAKSS